MLDGTTPANSSILGYSLAVISYLLSVSKFFSTQRPVQRGCSCAKDRSDTSRVVYSENMRVFTLCVTTLRRLVATVKKEKRLSCHLQHSLYKITYFLFFDF